MIFRKVLPKRIGNDIAVGNEKYYPSLQVSSDDLPEIKDWEVGDSYCIQMQVTMTGKNDYKGKISGNFDIKKFGLTDEEGGHLPDLDEEEDDDDDDDEASRSPRKAR